MHLRPADAHAARAQARWIVRMDPWRAMGYEAKALGAWLARVAEKGEGGVFLAAPAPTSAPLGLVVTLPEVLLGDFIALLAVRPEAAGQGVGRALMAAMEARTFARRRWLWVSHDADNADAARFYRRLGFRRAARLPDLVRDGRVEVLLSKRRPG